jgi:RNA polymerase sigma-70 factor (ECF subfamily)
VSSLRVLTGAGEASLTLSEEQRLALQFTDRIRLFAARHLNDPAAGEDVAQETLRRVVDALRAKRINDPNALPGFVFQTARNVCMHWVRSTAREKSAFARLAHESVDPSETTDALTSLISAERALTVKRAITRLSRDNQQLLVMMYYDGLNADEIARRLGVTAAAVRVRKHRALQRLSAELIASS